MSVSMIKYEVTTIFDGDTFAAKRRGKIETIRLNWIDAPEVKHNGQTPKNIIEERQWYWGDCAKIEVEKFIENSAEPGYIWVSPYEADKYGRILADVFSDYRYLNKYNLQRILLRKGLAVDFFPRMDKVVAADYQRIALFTSFLRSLYQAKVQQAGVWGDPNFTRPFDYRQSLLSVP